MYVTWFWCVRKKVRPVSCIVFNIWIWLLKWNCLKFLTLNCPLCFHTGKTYAIFINQTRKSRQQMMLSKDLQPLVICISFIIVRNAWPNGHVHAYLYDSILIQPIFLHKCFCHGHNSHKAVRLADKKLGVLQLTFNVVSLLKQTLKKEKKPNL